jgi:hypothetical protein
VSAGGSDEPGDATELRRAYDGVLERVAAACRRVGRDPTGVTVVAVSKTVSSERVALAIDSGIVVLGENRVQEAAAKVPLVPPASWHLVGPLQSNKARRALELFEVIQTVDSVDLGRRLDRLVEKVRPGRPMRVLVQVNVDVDPTKAGLDPSAAEGAIPELLELPNLVVEGIMTIGRLTVAPEDARPTFVALRALGERLRRSNPSLGDGLSMGMTDDFEVAVEEGATIVRVGRAIFGERGGPLG